MGLTQILFWLLSALAVASALMVITRKNPVHSVLYLVVTFFAISGHYILLNAQFLAVVNIIVYAGAIMVLFLFVVMLMNLNANSEPQKNKLLQFAGVISGGSLFLVLIAALIKSKEVSSAVEMQTGNYGLVKNLGQVLFKDYVLPFEISSVLFLSAMIGAVVISKKEH
ncbi:NADH-quinone oxidoreductase subunit J family protein [Ferruginibacter sp. SUN106]|uniref:NADH-quinone oxidoreductase subunit J family protein n=1 Tax=Ferruginibacter sp. SUN106 TaxID=2978348 RepID=UPI003D36405C